MSIINSICKSMFIRTDSDFIRNLDTEGNSSFTSPKLFESGIAYPDEAWDQSEFFNLMPLGVF